MMCPVDLAHLTLEFPDYYLIKPSITYFTPINYETNPLGEKGCRCRRTLNITQRITRIS